MKMFELSSLTSQKPFNTVTLPILLNKLEEYILGIRGILTAQTFDYFSNRKQRVTIDELTCDELLIVYGVPQGNILGPLIFLVYINELLTFLKFSLQRKKHSHKPNLVNSAIHWLRTNYT